MKKQLISIICAAVSIFSMVLSAQAAEIMYVANVENSVYLRTEPASDEYYTTVPLGAAVDSVGWQQGWDSEGYNEVIYNGQTGWIKTQYLSYVDPSSAQLSSSYLGTWYEGYSWEDPYNRIIQLDLKRVDGKIYAEFTRTRGKGIQYWLEPLTFTSGSSAYAYGSTWFTPYNFYADVKYNFEFYSDHIYVWFDRLDEPDGSADSHIEFYR